MSVLTFVLPERPAECQHQENDPEDAKSERSELQPAGPVDQRKPQANAHRAEFARRRLAPKNLSRALFVELQQVRLQRDQADMEWGRLQLELATRGALGRVMRIAGERLQMHVPRPEQIEVVK